VDEKKMEQMTAYMVENVIASGSAGKNFRQVTKDEIVAVSFRLSSMK
jgi:hypothetical protein